MTDYDPRFPPRRDVDARREPSALDRFFGGPPMWVFGRLVMLSLVVGVVMSLVGLDPFNIIESLIDLANWVVVRFRDFFSMGFEAVEQIARYILLGAAIVVPVWLVARLFKMTGSR